MKSKISYVSLIIICICFIAGTAVGKSIEVYPSLVNLQNVKPGEPFDLNRDAKISIHVPNQGRDMYYAIMLAENENKNYKGFQPWPDISWFEFSEDTFFIKHGDTAKINAVISIPDEEKFYNQAYMLPIRIKEVNKAGQVSVRVGVQLSITVKYFIETQTNRSIDTPPAGDIGVMPSVLYAKNSQGISAEEEIKIFNNDDVKHTYKLWTYAPEMMDTINIALDIPVSAGGHWIKNESWTCPKMMKSFFFFNKGRQITIGPRESKCYPLVIDIPASASFPEKVQMPGGRSYTPTFWEAIIMIESDTGEQRFCRVKNFVE